MPAHPNEPPSSSDESPTAGKPSAPTPERPLSSLSEEQLFAKFRTTPVGADPALDALRALHLQKLAGKTAAALQAATGSAATRPTRPGDEAELQQGDPEETMPAGIRVAALAPTPFTPQPVKNDSPARAADSSPDSASSYERSDSPVDEQRPAQAAGMNIDDPETIDSYDLPADSRAEALPFSVGGSSLTPPSVGTDIPPDDFGSTRVSGEGPARETSLDSGDALPFDADRQTAIDGSTVALPTQDTGHRPKKLSPLTRLDDYTSFRAMCDAFPERAGAARKQFGVPSEAMAQALDQHWQERFDDEPELRQQWQRLYESYRSWYDKNSG